MLLQPQYRDKKDFLKALRDAYADGSLDPKLAKIYFGERPYEELYDVKKDPAQLNNLIDDVTYAKDVARHRKLLDDWLAKGDAGAQDEPVIELKMANNKKWGLGLNAEYESIRKDSDGDGLSDTWEKLNDRDPADGKLLFGFDCGGWQTEGWEADGKLTNIAGRQGFLDFDLGDGTGAIRRDSLSTKIDSAKELQIRLRSDRLETLTLSVNGNKCGEVKIETGSEFNTYPLVTQPIAGDQVNSLRLDFKAPPGTTVEIDWIK